MSLSRWLVGGVLGLFAGALCGPVTSSAATGYVGYVGCDSTEEAAPSHVCQIGDEPGAFFESPEEEVEYEVCVTFPEGETLCAEEQLAEAGTLYVNEITTEVPGIHLVSWYIEGVEVAAWSFRMDLPPEPETPPVTPATTTPPITTPQSTTPAPSTSTAAPPATATSPPKSVVSAACRKDRQSMKRLERELKSATSASRRSTIRKHLNRARGASIRAC